MTHRVFLLSPASCAGKRARLLLRPDAEFDLAVRLRAARGDATLGEAFAFMSGLYFRGKLAYAAAFGRAPDGWSAAQVIAPGRGLLPAATPVTHADLLAMAAIAVDPAEPLYLRPLLRDARALAAALGPAAEAVLLGSIATEKYVEPLQEGLGQRLLVPREFVGRGDMSRGGLMLRCAAAGTPLTHVPAAAVPRRGPRPPRLGPRD